MESDQVKECPKCAGRRVEAVRGGFITCRQCRGAGQVPRRKRAAKKKEG